MTREHEEALALCADALSGRSVSKDTLRVVLGEARRFLASLRKRVANVEPSDVRKYLAACARTGVASTTIVAKTVRLRIFFKTLVGEHAVETDPTAPFSTDMKGTPPQLLLSDDDVRRLLVVASEESEGSSQPPDVVRALALRDRATVELLYALALRRSEAGAVRVQDLDLAEGTLRVRRAKRGESRELPLPRASLPALRAYLVEGRPVLAKQWRGSAGDYFLLSWAGAPLLGAGVWHVVRRVARRAGLDVHPHAFRRAVATHMVRAGVTIEAVRQFLGHAELSTTAIYVDVNADDLRRAIELLATIGA